MFVTLAIIGVVAVLTIPTLIQSYKEATRVMSQQSLLIGYKTTSSFVNELSNHIKIIKICDGDKLTNCFSDKFYWGSENTEIITTE